MAVHTPRCPCDGEHSCRLCVYAVQLVDSLEDMVLAADTFTPRNRGKTIQASILKAKAVLASARGF